MAPIRMIAERSSAPAWSGVSIVAENALAGASSGEYSISGAGDTSTLGFARDFTADVGETINFACHSTGSVIDIYRQGYYGGLGWRKITTISNAPTSQPSPVAVSGSNGGATCSNWTSTASWDIPEDAVSGLYVGVLRNAAQNGASWIPFVVTDHARPADVIVKTSDSTWNAYNYYGTPASPLSGACLYGIGTDFTIGDRSHVISYERPLVTRDARSQTYFTNAEIPLIRWIERNGYSVKYVSSQEVDRNPSCLSGAKIIISSGHDEYWSDNMRDAFEAARDAGQHLMFMSGNEVFWRTRFDVSDPSLMWCYKDTMPGPGGHTAGDPLDPVSGWSGTWKDTRWPGRKPENTITGTDFRMNGIRDVTVTLSSAAGYASHPAWRNSDLTSGDVTLASVVGFEADQWAPTQPAASTSVLASSVINVDGLYAGDNGENYTGNGDLDPWAIGSQRYSSGAAVLGFGTCQFQWQLDEDHDRGAGVPAVQAAQQMMTNVLVDLGASPSTPADGVTVSAPVSLDNYGQIP